MLDPKIIQFLEHIKISFLEGNLYKVSLGNYVGNIQTLKAIFIKPIQLKIGLRLSFTFHHKTKDEVKNYELIEALVLLESFLLEGFRIATLFSLEADYILETLPSHKLRLRILQASKNLNPTLTHDTQKKRAIQANLKPYLISLNVTDKTGKVLNAAQDKFRQINHYIEVLRPLFINFQEEIRLLDMGCGKGYLTFALFDYLQNDLQKKITATGVDMRHDLMDLCNHIAIENSFAKLNFCTGNITEFAAENYNVVIALHACDTATDEAIAKGIDAKASLIVVAPCCHKQIRSEMEKAKSENALQSLLSHGIFMERQAEMVTDTLRSLILEYCGYKTKVFEFVSDVHTPKNIMITAEKRNKALPNNSSLLNKIKDLKNHLGVKTHYLETLLGI
jgi:2-polyprenyl-3-methyl-5-hydroxy-6-metoxy-1,4-benzoquinol methylase